MYELEDGSTPTGGAVRFGFDENVLQKYSWRGYAIFSGVQVRAKYLFNVTFGKSQKVCNLS
jgi:hypothetical protein